MLVQFVRQLLTGLCSSSENTSQNSVEEASAPAELTMGLGFPSWRSGKGSAWQCRRRERLSADLWVRKSPWSRNWQPTPVFLPRKFHGIFCLVLFSSSLWNHIESDATKQLSMHAHGDRGGGGQGRTLSINIQAKKPLENNK